jgi:hypothetical protein
LKRVGELGRIGEWHIGPLLGVRIITNSHSLILFVRGFRRVGECFHHTEIVSKKNGNAFSICTFSNGSDPLVAIALHRTHPFVEVLHSVACKRFGNLATGRRAAMISMFPCNPTVLLAFISNRCNPFVCWRGIFSTFCLLTIFISEKLVGTYDGCFAIAIESFTVQ